jgi:hypothetical protein
MQRSSTMGMVGVRGTTGDESGDGSRWGIKDAGNSAANVIEKGGSQLNMDANQNALIEDRAESGDASSAQSTGKMDLQAPGWTKGY